MKKCPFCAEEIQDDALKCRYCHEYIDDFLLKTTGAGKLMSEKPKWYFTPAFVVFALLSIGPLALPLIWFNPRYGIISKVVISVIVIAVSIWLYHITMVMYSNVEKQLNDPQLKNMLRELQV